MYALLPDLAWEKTFSAKIINKKKTFKGVTHVIELDQEPLWLLTRYGVYLVGLGLSSIR